MASFTVHLLAALTFLGAAETEAVFAQSGKAAPKRRVTSPPTYLQTPQKIHYFVSRKEPANLTWVATDVCKMEIKCNGEKFQQGRGRVCGKTCKGCKTRKKTKIISVSDFPGGNGFMTCQCKVWGTKAVRSEIIKVEKAFLRRNFGKVDVNQLALHNTTVILQCKPPSGAPRPNITWYKNGEPLFFGRGRRVRVNTKRDLVIKRLRTSDTGEYRCVAENMVGRREGLVIRLVVRGNISTTNDSSWTCSGQSSEGCKSDNSSSFDSTDSDPLMLVVGTKDALFTIDLRNTSKSTRIQAKDVVSLDFSSNPNQIYWSDKKGINQLTLHNGVREVMPFHHGDVNSVNSIAIDSSGNKLYWTDAVHDAIYLGDLRNGRRVQLIWEKLDFPRAIAVSHSDGYIYWTSWGQAANVERARLDGTERKTLISNGIQFPNGLALDESERKLYWAGTDANKCGIIESVSLDGLNRSVIFYHRGYHPFSLDIFEGHVYWSDWGRNAVLRINKSDGSGEEVIVADLHKPMGLKIFHQRNERRGDPCEENNGGCEHLCLYLPFSERKRCFCKKELKLKENGETCENYKHQGESKVDQPKDHNTHLLVMIIVIILLLLALVVGAIVVNIKNCRSSSGPADLPRVARRTREDNRENSDGRVEEDLATDQTELMQECSPPNESPDLNAQMCSTEPSRESPVSGDSSVELQRNVVVYMTNHLSQTKVDVEQHIYGGVSVVGDRAKVSYHHPPQSL